ncbi:MAG TPA: hypothetical protein VGG64_12370 [Pirellulales bacterium]|jgi:hypothetical protein
MLIIKGLPERASSDYRCQAANTDVALGLPIGNTPDPLKHRPSGFFVGLDPPKLRAIRLGQIEGVPPQVVNPLFHRVFDRRIAAEVWRRPLVADVPLPKLPNVGIDDPALINDVTVRKKPASPSGSAESRSGA